MSTLEEIALNNLKVLTHPFSFKAHKFTLKRNELVTEDDSNFETIYTFDELEYAIYFTFHQLLNHVHSNYGGKFYGYTRQALLNLMEDGIDTLCETYEQSDMTNTSFEALLEDLDDKVYHAQQYYKYGLCLWLPTYIKEYMNTTCKTMIEVSKYIQRCHGDLHTHVYISSDDDDVSTVDEASGDEASDDDDVSSVHVSTVDEASDDGSTGDGSSDDGSHRQKED